MAAARKLNTRLVATLTITSLVVLTLIVAIIANITSKGRNPEVYAEKAKAAMNAAKPNYPEAIRNYSMAYQFSGNDTKWLLPLADAYYTSNDVQKALGTLKRALVVKPDFLQAQERILRIYQDDYFKMAGLNSPSDLLKEMGAGGDEMLKMLPSDPATMTAEQKKSYAFALFNKALGLFGQRSENRDATKQSYDMIAKAIDVDPDSDYIDTLVMFNADQARENIKSARAAGNAIDIYSERIDAIRKLMTGSEGVYLAALKTLPGNSKLELGLANFYNNTWAMIESFLGEYCQGNAQSMLGQNATLEQQLRTLRADTQGDTSARRHNEQKINAQMSENRRSIPKWTALSENHTKNANALYAQAGKTYQTALDDAKTNDEKIEAILAKASFELNHNRIAEAEKLAQEALKIGPDRYRPYLLAVTINRQQAAKLTGAEADAKISDSIALLNKRLRDLPHEFRGAQGRTNRNFYNVMLMTQTELYLARQSKDDLPKIDENIKLLQSELGERWEVYLLKGRKDLLDGLVMQAIKDVEKADSLAQEGNPRIKLALAEMYLNRDEIGAAQTAIDRALDMAPNSPEVLQMAARIYGRLNQPLKMLEFSERILATPGITDTTAALGMKLDALVALNQLEQADKVAAQLEKNNPNLNWDVNKAAILIRQKKNEQAEALLRDALLKNSKDSTARALLIDMLMSQKRDTDAVALVNEALKIDPQDKAFLRIKDVLSVADPEQRAKRITEIRTEMDQERQAESLKNAEGVKDPFMKAVALFDQYLRQNDNEKARQYLDEARKLDPRRSNAISFRFALATADWKLAQECADKAKVDNLDSIGGMLYEGQLANARAWRQVYDVDGKDDKNNETTLKTIREAFEKSTAPLLRATTDLPNMALPRALLGEAYAWTDRMDDAEIQTAKAAELNPTDPYVMRAQACIEWYIISRNPARVTGELVQKFAQNVASASRQMPWDTWLQNRRNWLIQQGQRQAEVQADQQDDAGKVVERREKIRKEKPADIANLVRLAWVYENRDAVKNIDKAQECYEQALRTQIADEALAPFGTFITRNKRTEQAQTFLTDLARERAKEKKGDGYIALASFCRMNNDAAGAEKALLEAVNVEDTAEKRLRLAAEYASAGNAEKAIDWAKKVLQASPSEDQQVQARVLMIDMLRQKGEWAQAQTAIADFQKAHPKDARGQLFEASLAMDQADNARAEKILTDLLAKNPENLQALDARSSAAIYAWKLEQAKADLEKIANVAPQALGFGAYIRLAKLYCELSRPADAVRQTRELISRVAGNNDALEQIRVDLMPAISSALPAADYEQLLMWAAGQSKDYFGWNYELGMLAMRENKFDKAQQALGQAWATVRLKPSTAAGRVLDAYLQAMFKAGNFSAIARETRALTENVKQPDPRILAWQAAASFKTGQGAQGAATFVRALQGTGGNPLFINHLTGQIALEGIPAAKLLPLLEAQLTQTPDAADLIKQAIGACYFATDDYTRGIATFKALAEKTTDKQTQSSLYWVAAQELTNKKQYEQAVAQLQLARQATPDAAPILNNLAYILAEYLDKADDGAGLIEKAYRVAPNNPDLLDTYGLVLSHTPEKDKALVYASKSVWIRESAASRYHLGVQLQAAGRQRDARLQLQRALTIVGSDKELKERIQKALGK